MPHHTAALGGCVGRPGGLDAVDRPVDGEELLVAADLAHDPTILDLEDLEVADDVDQVRGCEHPREQAVLRRGGPTDEGAQGVLAARVVGLPLQEKPARRPDGPVGRPLAAGRHEQLDGLEQAGRALTRPLVVGFLVAAQLLDRLALPRVADRGRLALDHRDGDAVEEDRHIGNDVALGAADLVLAGDQELVVGWVVEVDEVDGLGLLASAEVLLERDAVGQRGVVVLAGLGEGGGGDLGDGLDRPLEVVVADPGVETSQGGGETVDEDRVLERRSLGVEGLGGDVGEAEGLEQLDCGCL